MHETSSSLLLPDVVLERLQPFLENGIRPVAVAAFQSFAFPYGETILFAMVLPAARRPQEVTRWLVLGVLVAGLFHLVAGIRTITVLSEPILVNSTLPSLHAIRQISVAEFLTRVEPLIVGNFLMAAWMKLCVVAYAASLAAAQLLGLRDYRSITLPLAILLLGLATLIRDDVIELETFAAVVWPVYAFPFQVLIPLVLFAAAAIRRR